MRLNKNILTGIIHNTIAFDFEMKRLYRYFKDMGENVDCGTPGFVVIYQGLDIGGGNFENIWFWFDEKYYPESIKINTLDIPDSMWKKIDERFDIEETFNNITITEKDGSCSMDTFLKFFNLAKAF